MSDFVVPVIVSMVIVNLEFPTSRRVLTERHRVAAGSTPLIETSARGGHTRSALAHLPAALRSHELRF